MPSKPRRAAADQCCLRITWDDLDREPIRTLIQLARDEDLFGSGLRIPPKNPGDHSSFLLPEGQSLNADLRARAPMTLCGLPLAKELLVAYDSRLSLETRHQDGDAIEKDETIASLHGPIRSALSVERPLLNFLQRLSGIATATRRFADAIAHTSTRLLDTRKTTPGYRMLEKYAVACGGGWNHRIGLFDRVMLKDNHLASFGDNLESAAIEAVRSSRAKHPDLLVEMEVDRLEQIGPALAADVDIILLDNFGLDDLAEALRQIDGQVVTEASGGITLGSIGKIAEVGPDFISTGAVVHQSVWVDIGLDWSQ